MTEINDIKRTPEMDKACEDMLLMQGSNHTLYAVKMIRDLKKLSDRLKIEKDELQEIVSKLDFKE